MFAEPRFSYDNPHSLSVGLYGMNSLQQKSYVYNQESNTYQIQFGASVVEIAVEVIL